MHECKIFLILILFSLFNCEHPVGHFQFPQGVASGDPHPNGVVLWTRIVPKEDNSSIFDVQVEVAKDEDFQNMTISKNLVTSQEGNYIIRPYIDNLQPYTRYYFRFIAGKDTSEVGRTITAPANNQVHAINLATIACQSYEQGFFGTLKTLIEEDKKRPDHEKIDVVIHLGDFIYEVVGDDPRNDNHHPVWLKDRNGIERSIPPFPTGAKRLDIPGEWKSGSTQPFTVDDFRHLYQVYLSNPVMKEARARWPFIYTWDDHEFADGNHQSFTPAAEKTGHPGFQSVKVAANQVWFEYLPSALDQATTIPGVKKAAYDFRPTQVENVPLDPLTKDGLYQEINNLKAIQSICIYRTLQWGKDILIIVPDTKSYQLPGYSVLGDQQKEWFKSILANSNTKWKIWANSEPISDAQINFSALPELQLEDQSLYNDSWASNPNETKEILSFIQENEIPGVVALSGDYHIQMAGMAGMNETPIVPDFTVTSMSSFADFFWLDRKGAGFKDEKIAKIFSFSSEDSLKQPNINTAMLYGVETALIYAQTNDWSKAINKAAPANPWFQYFDCEHNGYLTASIINDTMQVEFVNTKNARKDFEEKGAPIVSRVGFELPLWEDRPFPVKTHQEGSTFPISKKVN